MVGLRMEYTRGEGEVEEDRSKDFSRENWSLFPSATFNYAPTIDNTISLSFSSGIRRPEFTLLNPFRVYTSEISYRENNPFLKNLKTYNVNFTYTYKNNYIAQISHFSSRHAWSLFKIPIEGTNITRELFCNYGNLSMTNFSLIWNESLFDELLYVNYSFGGYYSHTKGNVESTQIDVSGYVPYLYLSNSIHLSKKQNLRMMLSYNFMGTEKMANVTREPVHNLNFRIQKGFGDVIIGLGVNDILNLKVTESYKIDSYSYLSTLCFNRRNAWISATYNWGNQKVKGARNRRTNTETNRRIN